MPLVTLNSGRNFNCDSPLSLLDAATKAGIGLPYSCKTGRCSACKCKVLSGQSSALGDELGLTSDDKKQGFILSCVRTAKTDMIIEVEDLGDQIIPEVKILPARITSLEKLASDVLSIKLRLPPSAQFTYLAGQYIDVIGPNGLRRSYSIANAPTPDMQLQLHIRVVQGGAMSGYWVNQAKANDLVRINGPLGSFFMRSLAGLHLVFLVTGTGIAPAKAMIEQLASVTVTEQPLSVTVYWGGREIQDLYTNPLQWHPALRYEPVLSRPHDAWTGAQGYVQEALLADAFDLSSTVVYACGSNVMIQSAKNALSLAGLPDKRFYSDAFIPSGT